MIWFITLGRISVRMMRGTEQPMGLGLFRAQGRGLLVAGDGLGQVVALLVGEAEILPNFSVIGLNFHGALPVADGLVELVLRLPSVADGVEDLRVVGLNGLDALETGARAVPLVLLLVEQSQFHEGGHRGAVELDGGGKKLCGLLQVSREARGLALAE